MWIFWLRAICAFTLLVFSGIANDVIFQLSSHLKFHVICKVQLSSLNSLFSR